MRVHVLSDDGIFAVAVKLETIRNLIYFPQADCLELTCIFLEGPTPRATYGPFNSLPNFFILLFFSFFL